MTAESPVDDISCEKKRMRKTKGHDENYCDTAKLIRDLQKAEGGPQCFGKANGDCEREHCAWRAYCLGELNETKSLNIRG
jgi:hypothetical protein